MKYKSTGYCPNCHFPLPYKAKFCAQCGQKTGDGRMSLGGLFKQLWFRVLHLESRSLRFMLLLFIPGYVTKEFFAGRQKRFPQPIRFFFITAFLFLFTLNHLSKPTSYRAQQTDHGLVFNGKPSPQKIKYDFYELGKRQTEFETMRQEFDSLPEEYRTPLVRKAVDSLLQRTYGEAVEKFGAIMAMADTTQGGGADSISFNLGFRKSIRLATADAFRLDPDSIISKYAIRSWVDQMAVKQGLKTLQDPSALMQAYLGNLAWTILALVVLMAGVLKLLYLRQRRFFVEHFFLMLNEHSALFLILLVAILINAVFPLKTLWLIPTLWSFLSPVLAMKQYYGQSWKWTILKSTALLIAYLLGFILLFTLGMLIVFFVF